VNILSPFSPITVVTPSVATDKPNLDLFVGLGDINLSTSIASIEEVPRALRACAPRPPADNNPISASRAPAESAAWLAALGCVSAPAPPRTPYALASQRVAAMSTSKGEARLRRPLGGPEALVFMLIA
jgi:hypothetical protein